MSESPRHRDGAEIRSPFFAYSSSGAGKRMDDCLRERFVVVDDFLPEEQGVAMREDIDAHFSNPSRHEPATHQVWNYWYVPGSYTYLRTTPEKVIARDKVERFVNA